MNIVHFSFSPLRVKGGNIDNDTRAAMNEYVCVDDLMGRCAMTLMKLFLIIVKVHSKR